MLNNGAKELGKPPRNAGAETDDFFAGKPQAVKSFDDAAPADPSGEHTLQRVTSYKTLEHKGEACASEEGRAQAAGGSPRALSKTDATSKLPDVLLDEEEADLARQVMEVSSAQSNGSPTPLKDELKESLRSQNFFMSKMDGAAAAGQSPKGGLEGDRRPEAGNIRIEIEGETQERREGQPQGASGKAVVGAVSPLSGASSDFGIQRGSVSLESSTSGEQRQQLQQVIAQVNEPAEDTQIAAKTEELTDEILQLLVAEMRLDFDYMVSRRDSRAQQEEEQQQQQVQGIKTDLFAIERYVDEVLEEIKGKSPAPTPDPQRQS